MRPLAFNDAMREDRGLAWLFAFASPVIMLTGVIVATLRLPPPKDSYPVVMFVLGTVFLWVQFLVVWVIRAGLLVLANRITIARIAKLTKRLEALNAAKAARQARMQHAQDVLNCIGPCWNRYGCLVGVCVIAATKRFREEPSGEVPSSVTSKNND